ncbi:hypothetical protein GCM10011579_067570 [Streptomyces albiflavescens]|uniref:Uncharacterized protein n=1 Tax=Streptomyces albiflavescens TaxID=1623582 RepID=A0A917YAL8_9ACTN|nr:hypothetical protein GCM10011579_067570 [Streptomyces albiflavescens]
MRWIGTALRGLLPRLVGDPVGDVLAAVALGRGQPGAGVLVGFGPPAGIARREIRRAIPAASAGAAENVIDSRVEEFRRSRLTPSSETLDFLLAVQVLREVGRIEEPISIEPVSDRLDGEIPIDEAPG